MRRHDFNLPADVLYMCGHSLGPTPQSAESRVTEALKQWSEKAVQAWNTAQWMELPNQVAEMLAPLLGAQAGEVTVTDSTSVNLFKVLMSALQLQPKRRVILSTEDNFPSDLYIGQGIAAFNKRVILKTVPNEALLDNLDESVAVLMLTHVNYRDAKVFDMAAMTAHAHRFGIIVIWDLSHSVGAVSIDCTAADVDFAVGCTYKYLNGGPGSPAFVYVNARHHSKITSPIYGWMGHTEPFAFKSAYHSSGACIYQTGTPGILSLKSLQGALELFQTVDQDKLYEKSREHSSILITALENLSLRVLTPTLSQRGGHVAFLHPQAYGLSKALIHRGLIGDHRQPQLIRLCINPLYLSSDEIQQAAALIKTVLDEKSYLLPQYQLKTKVT